MSHVPDESRDEAAPPQYEVEDPESGGTADPSAKFREQDPPSDQELQEIERERAERLAPENRPENAEVDNTDRTFDPARGDFID